VRGGGHACWAGRSRRCHDDHCTFADVRFIVVVVVIVIVVVVVVVAVVVVTATLSKGVPREP